MGAPFRLCLLIDDSHLDNLINSEIIKMDNFASEIVIIEAPDKALLLLKTGQLKPDIIFLDIRMPEMSGFEFLAEYNDLDIDKDIRRFSYCHHLCIQRTTKWLKIINMCQVS
ncbi:response regulator [Mucilaginibacter sp. UYCu711]|uniref:response regulator n=1 Tax=Mucilaginibacter sp. UYCu711 TaxID=3156339 RepID=UPI003D2185D3